MNDTNPAETEAQPAEETTAPASSPAPPPASDDSPRRHPAAGFNTLYWCYLGLAIGGALLTVTVFLAIFGLPILIASAVCAAIFMYRAWDQIQDGHQRATPALAVGLSFVPLFNFYWFFISVWGLSKDLNAYSQRHNIDAPRVNDGLALALCVMIAAGLVYMFIPIVNVIAWLATIPVALVVMNDFRKASMAIAESQ